MKREAIPNLLSAFRILLIPPVLWALLEQHYLPATALIALAVFTDGLDGFLARRFQWHSRIGGILDPIADKLLFASVFLTLGYLGHIPLWLMLLVIGRDVVIAAGALLYEKLIGPVVAQPTLLSKINTLTLFFFTAALLLKLSGLDFIDDRLLALLRLAVVATVVASGLQYVTVWSARAWREKGSHAP